MVISHALRYVYIGIPRTSSKSMTRWLIDSYEGEFFGFHHSFAVPDEAKDYLVFTVVRNPYDRHVSSAFNIPWGDVEPNTSLREERELEPVPGSLEDRIKGATLRKDATVGGGGNVPERVMNQWLYCKAAGVSRVLFFERIPGCFRDLPFVDAEDQLPEYPRALERGIRPPGSFFDHFGEDEEKVVWAYESETFEGFGYRRFDAGLPAASPDSLAIS